MPQLPNRDIGNMGILNDCQANTRGSKTISIISLILSVIVSVMIIILTAWIYTYKTNSATRTDDMDMEKYKKKLMGEKALSIGSGIASVITTLAMLFTFTQINKASQLC